MTAVRTAVPLGALAELVGAGLGPGPWVTIDQARIDSTGSVA
jgi:hypothetical protein